MVRTRPIFLFAFANDAKASLRLGEEQNACWNELASLHDENKIECNRMGFATLRQIYRELNRYNNRVYVFHYGGHSNSEVLKLRDTDSYAYNLGVKIGQQRNLKLVFLNGCKNHGQLDFLFKNNVPAIIATNANIEDEKAIEMARQFYQTLAGGSTILQAFKSARAFILDKYPRFDGFSKRDIIKVNNIKDNLSTER